MSFYLIDNPEVQGQTASFSGDVAAKQSEAESALSQLHGSLDTSDGFLTDDTLFKTETNMKKAQSYARGYTKATGFVAGASEQMRMEDLGMASSMQLAS